METTTLDALSDKLRREDSGPGVRQFIAPGHSDPGTWSSCSPCWNLGRTWVQPHRPPCLSLQDRPLSPAKSYSGDTQVRSDRVPYPEPRVWSEGHRASRPDLPAENTGCRARRSASYRARHMDYATTHHFSSGEPAAKRPTGCESARILHGNAILAQGIAEPFTGTPVLKSPGPDSRILALPLVQQHALRSSADRARHPH